MNDQLVDQFVAAAHNVGAVIHRPGDLAAVVQCIREHVDGTLLVSSCPSLARIGVAAALKEAGVECVEDDFRTHGAAAAAGLTGANLGIAATGTVVLESTDEAVRIATTLPAKHFVLLDPQKIIATADEVVSVVREFHDRLPQAYLAYITGPSRTADIERVLTIGVHGPVELHLLLLDGMSDNPMER